jgi:hypothetical protein
MRESVDFHITLVCIPYTLTDLMDSFIKLLSLSVLFKLPKVRVTLVIRVDVVIGIEHDQEKEMVLVKVEEGTYFFHELGSAASLASAACSSRRLWK